MFSSIVLSNSVGSWLTIAIWLRRDWIFMFSISSPSTSWNAENNNLKKFRNIANEKTKLFAEINENDSKRRSEVVGRISYLIIKQCRKNQSWINWNTYDCTTFRLVEAFQQTYNSTFPAPWMPDKSHSLAFFDVQVQATQNSYIFSSRVTKMNILELYIAFDFLKR